METTTLHSIIFPSIIFRAFFTQCSSQKRNILKLQHSVVFAFCEIQTFSYQIQKLQSLDLVHIELGNKQPLCTKRSFPDSKTRIIDSYKVFGSSSLEKHCVKINCILENNLVNYTQIKLLKYQPNYITQLHLCRFFSILSKKTAGSTGLRAICTLVCMHSDRISFR